MLKWTPYAFIRITLAFVAGILLGIYNGELISRHEAFIGSAGFLTLYFILFLLIKKKFFSLNWLLSVTGFATIFLLGYLNLNLSNQSLRDDHIIHIDSLEYYVGVVNRPPQEKNKTYLYQLEVERARTSRGWEAASGKVYLYMDKSNPQYSYGDKFLIKGTPDELRPPMNPGEFNYKRFLTFRNVYHQDYVKDNYRFAGHETPNPVLEKAFEFRAVASAILSTYIESNRENNIAQALVLGIKDGLDNDIKNAYSASGAMHVLAVSGLHVGIIYAIVLLLFKPFRKTKIRNWLLAVVSLIVLWSYALVTGFSPSVLRAVTMFSFIAIAQATGRNTNIYNTLAASAFILLLFDPYLIMSVGFQLSFLAVIGIVYLQPRIYNLFLAENYLLDKVWAITAVSIAAQIATFPLTILYFHQFPSFFLLSNLVVIPGAFVILCLGIILLVVSQVGVIAEAVGFLMKWIIFGVNEVVFAIDRIPYSQITQIEISTFQSWLIILSIISLILLFQIRKFKYLLFTVGLVSLFSFKEVQQLLTAKNQHSITFYRVNGHPAIDFIDGTTTYFYTDSAFRQDDEGTRFHIRPHRLASSLLSTHKVDDTTPFMYKDSVLTSITWCKKKVLILENKIAYNLKIDKSPQADLLILAKAFNKDMDWVIDNFKFDELVLDGSLPWYRADEYKDQCDKKHIKYYSVYHDGAYELSCN